ncbi:hypothetical protein, partial [Vibrio diazotrophicus]|uniref:hypothetical protein n=1 Tax=Vibrio diazotrophicus TaxID=685 RepID=UPI001CA541C2
MTHYAIYITGFHFKEILSPSIYAAIAARMSKSFAHSLLLQGRQCLRNGTDDKPLNINHNHN